jgi:aryl-alcohol dehydrogenase-like predicted oxidoreductase
VQQWDHPDNKALAQRVQHFAAARGLTTREVNVAWLLNQPFPVAAVVSIPSPLITRRTEYERASQLLLDDDCLHVLNGGWQAAN